MASEKEIAEIDQAWRESMNRSGGIRPFLSPNFPTIVTLCGSTRFKDEWIAANERETHRGKIVLSVGCFRHDDNCALGEGATKEQLDDLHKRKIDLSDEILVIDVGGYIGSSTRSEIDYAFRHGKKVRYLSLEFNNEPS